MPELGPYGSVRGARGNSRPYRERHLLGMSISHSDPERSFASDRHLRSLVGYSRAQIRPFAPGPQTRGGPTYDFTPPLIH